MSSGRRPAHEEMDLEEGMISSRQLSERTGVSMRQLDWWVKAGFLIPHQAGIGKGSRRLWRESMVETIAGHGGLVDRMKACPYDHKTT